MAKITIIYKVWNATNCKEWYFSTRPSKKDLLKYCCDDSYELSYMEITKITLVK